MTPKILVVDDFKPIQNMYVDALKRFHMDTITADNGVDALQLVFDEKPDVILLDFDLPRLTGLEVLEQVRQNPETQNTCVIMITGNHIIEHSDIIANADLVLIKPVSAIDVVNLVKRFLPAIHSA